MKVVYGLLQFSCPNLVPRVYFRYARETIFSIG